MKISEIRKTFYDFFKEKDHQIVPSAPMVVKDDPSLMFINAGMNQFKDCFLGNVVPEKRRIANSQKCLRVSGKHNDLEEVGVDTYHHTMFEMLGNWSFGDYFKEEAIEWAWELITKVYKLPEDRLYVTVFEGDNNESLNKDQESIEIWKKYVSEDRIILASKKDNFWEMGEIGPCGPCTEIHIDLRNDDERKKIKGKDLINKEHYQVIEIWNIVFIQYNRKTDKSLEDLPETHVDTGMGLERLAMALQGKQSNYDIDLFQSLIQKLEQISGKKYGADEHLDVAMRVISDHIRAIAFSITDGQLPSNNGAGYVIRRILRRALRYAYQFLELKTPFLGELLDVLEDQMGSVYPELSKQKPLICRVIEEEELSFFKTLENGMKRMDQLISDSEASGKDTIDGESVFELYDTFGFPLDLTSLIARENNLTIDKAGFDSKLQEQKNRSRKATKLDVDDWVVLVKGKHSEFIGYDEPEAEVSITQYRKVNQKGKEFYQLVLNQTPFYPEGGGQIGDQGLLKNEKDKLLIFDTKKENEMIVHFTKDLPKNPDAIFDAEVSRKKRINCAKNHSATHLLHHALRNVLGNHVEQKGSLVTPDYLRFDFSHFSKVSTEELHLIQLDVLNKIKENIVLEVHRNIPIDEAKEMGAMALFGEKYSSEVRVVKFGSSVELCGGTHVPNTRAIGMFLIQSESAVAAGVRRIEAISGDVAEHYFRSRSESYEDISALFNKPKNLQKAIEDLFSKNKELSKEVERLQKLQTKSLKKELESKISSVNKVNFLGEVVEISGANAKDLLFQFKSQFNDFVGVLGTKLDGKCGVHLIVSDNLVSDKNINAAEWIKEISPLIQGGGGGQANYASAGGKKEEKLAEAIELIKKKL